VECGSRVACQYRSPGFEKGNVSKKSASERSTRHDDCMREISFICALCTCIMCRVGHNHKITVYVRYCLAGKSPHILSYTVYIYTVLANSKYV